MLSIAAAAVAAMCVLCALQPVHALMPPLFRCRGTYFECGGQIGLQAKWAIAQRLRQDDVQQALKLIETTTEGKAAFANLQMNAKMLLPDIVNELSGIATGSGQSYNSIFLLNSLDEILGMPIKKQGEMEKVRHRAMPNPWLAPSCSDVGTAFGVMGHNEDNVKFFANYTYFVDATIVSADNSSHVVERFRAFAYPGCMAGNMFGYNEKLAFSDNFIFIFKPNLVTSVPSNLRGRRAYRARSIDEVLTMMSSVTGGSASNFNTFSFETGNYMSIETNPLEESLGVKQIPLHRPLQQSSSAAAAASPKQWHAHTNMFVYLRNDTGSVGLVDPSSVVRLERLNQLAAMNGIPKNVSDIRRMLGDTEHSSSYPIYRPGTAKDSYIATLATFIVDRQTQQIFIWGLKNPKETAPDAVWPLTLD